MKPNKGDQLFAEIILKQYQERTGERKDKIESFIEVFRKSVAITMLEFKQSYQEIFAELPMKSSEEFYKMVFRNSNKGLLENMAIPPCLVKDFFDGNLDEIRTGGRSANIIRNLGNLIDEEKEEEVASLAASWEIINPGWRIFKDLDSPRNLKCCSIPSSPIDFDQRVFTELLKENLPELVFYLESKLGFRPPMRDIPEEEKTELKWADTGKRVRFDESSFSATQVSNLSRDSVVHGAGKLKDNKGIEVS